LENWLLHLSQSCRRKYEVKKYSWHDHLTVPDRKDQIMFLEETVDVFYAMIWDWEPDQVAFRVSLLVRNPVARQKGEFQRHSLQIKVFSAPMPLVVMRITFPRPCESILPHAVVWTIPIWVNYDEKMTISVNYNEKMSICAISG